MMNPCQHCEGDHGHSPCVSVCPATATDYDMNTGIVSQIYTRCFGCRYCMAACPYDARYLQPDKRIVNKCTFCERRVDKGVVPACVNTCQGGARIFGDLNDPTSEVAKLVAREPVQVLKPELGTEPRVFYIGADKGVMGRVRKEV